MLVRIQWKGTFLVLVGVQTVRFTVRIDLNLPQKIYTTCSQYVEVIWGMSYLPRGAPYRKWEKNKWELYIAGSKAAGLDTLKSFESKYTYTLYTRHRATVLDYFSCLFYACFALLFPQCTLIFSILKWEQKFCSCWKYVILFKNFYLSLFV